MHPINAVGGLPLGEKRLEKLRQPIHNPAEITQKFSSQKPSIGPQLPTPRLEDHPLTANQANAVKLLAFAGQGNKHPHAARLENDFLRSLKQSKNHTEKAALADILGRAQSVKALPHLMKLLNENEHIQVRTSAAQALANIGSSAHLDGFTTPDISHALLEAYQKRKAHLQADIENLEQLSYDAKLKRHEAHADAFDEIATLVNGVSQLDVVRGNSALLTELRTRLAVSQMKEAVVQELISNKDVAEEKFHKDLQNRYGKPISEILKSIPSDELKEMQKEVKVSSIDGKEINLLEMKKEIERMQLQHEQFDLRLVGSLMDAVSMHNDRSVNAVIKQGLKSEHPSIKARALSTLADRNSLNYSTDVYPNLSARHADVRQAALEALLNSPEPAAKQKALELMSPNGFFQVAGGFSREALGNYVDFLTELAERGDEYVDAITSRVMNPDYSLESRQMGLQVLGLMTRSPIAALVSPQTAGQAKTVLKLQSLSAAGKTPAEKQAITTSATALWVQTKDPVAIPIAITLAEGKDRKVSGEDQERLLGSVMTVLMDDAKARNRPEQKGQLQNNVLDILKTNKSHLLKDVSESDLRVKLHHKSLKDRINPATKEDLAEDDGLEVDKGIKDHLKPALALLRPALTSLAESDKSQPAQMMAFRIMGLLQDTDTLNYLCERVNNPLKGKVDWKADVSFRGDPEMLALNLRANALKALGDMGDARALKTMTKALDNSILQNMISEPLAKLAPDANKKEKDEQIGKVRRKLISLMETSDTSRGMRAVRMKAANALYQFNGGPDALKAFVAKTTDPNFKRHALSALITNGHGLEPEHPDYDLVKDMLNPGLGVERLHSRGITGKGVEMGIVDGGYVDESNKEGFQNRVKLPGLFDGDPESTHPTMVMSTAAANGKLKGVAPGAKVYSDKWPAFDSKDPMDVYKKMIQGKLRGENNIKVINNSWGFSNSTAILHKDVRTILKEFKTVVDMAEKAGIQIVFAAGNEGEAPGFPQLGTVSVFGLDVDKLTDDQKKQHDYLLDKVITVGAVNTQGSERRTNHRLAEFSSVGDSFLHKMKPTLIAPGADMMVYSWDKNKKGNPKELVNGTSFASPFISGLICLMHEANAKANNPHKLTPADVRDILKKTSVKLGGIPMSQQGYGEVHPEAAVSMAETYDNHKASGTGSAAPTHEPPEPPPGDDGDIVMGEAPSAATLASSGHKRSRGISPDGNLDRNGVETRASRYKRSRKDGVTFSGLGHSAATQPGSVLNILSGKGMPSSASSAVLSRVLSGAARMNPPNPPVLDIIR